MFEMPLDTFIEICDTKDVGYALANAVEKDEIWGEILHIAGRDKRRISYREYLNEMMSVFGIGATTLPEEAFSKNGFHCGFMTTTKSQNLLKYQRHTLDDYFNDVRKKVAISRLFTKMFRPIARKILLNKSEYYRKYLHSINSLKLSSDL